MNIQRSLLVGATLAAVTLGGGGLAMAATNTSSTSGNTLVDKIATKFNLNKSDVQAVFDANRAEHRTQVQAKQKERLTQAVKDGKLTQAQADHIQSVRDEIDRLIGNTNPRNISAAVHAQIKQKLYDLHTWADQQNIDEKYVLGGHGRGGMHGMMGDKDASNNTSGSSNSSNTN